VKHVLTGSHRLVLERLMSSDPLLAFDFDGTLAPLVANRAEAKLRPTTRRLLSDVAARHPCAVISGRARSDVGARLDGVRVAAVAGNHGVEPWAASPAAARATEHWRELLKVRLRGLAGVEIEDKRYTLSVHYRRALDPLAVQIAIESAVEDLPGARLIGGHAVINVVPAGTGTKGTALLRILSSLGRTQAMYVGDDETDEDVFGLPVSGHLVSIHIGTHGSSKAEYYLRAQEEIDDLLRALLELAPVSRRT
jgi:trehalose 6-phosphate phosphatase